MGAREALIGVSGVIGVGKTEVTTYLSRAYGLPRAEMSDFVAEELDAMMRVHGKRYDPAQKERYRLLLQGWGHLQRYDDPDHWLRYLDRLPRPGVIGGIRYPNEVKRIQRDGGQVWRVVRPGAKGYADKAQTEVQLTDDMPIYDQVIQNDGTLEQLFRKVDALVVAILGVDRTVEPV